FPPVGYGTSISATAGKTFNGVVASFTDSDSSAQASSYTITITWGDGHMSVGQVSTNANGSFMVTGTNTYAQAGSYTVTVQITDNDGTRATANSTATVAAGTDLTVSGLNITATAGQSFNGVVASIT